MNTHPNEFPNLPERLNGLRELAENIWWSWNPSARMLFKMQALRNLPGIYECFAIDLSSPI